MGQEFFNDEGFGLHLLGHRVRDLQAMSLTERMRRLTSQPASIFGMTDLGMVKEGMAADLLLFGPATVGRGQGGGYLYCPVALHV